MNNPIEMYGWEDIQLVYKQFHECSWTVVYSIDGGLSWQSCPMDTGKWGDGLEPDVRRNMKFAFLKTKSFMFGLSEQEKRELIESAKRMVKESEYTSNLKSL